MLDISVAYNRYKFLGYEFLTWLWYITATGSWPANQPQLETARLAVGNRIVLQNHTTAAMETVTIKGDEADLKEGLLALRKGALVSEISLVLSTSELEYSFVLKGESLSLSGLKLPVLAQIEDDQSADAAILEKIYLIEALSVILEAFYHTYLDQRLSPYWGDHLLPDMSTWAAKTDQ